jgi:hypothetical protein
MFTPCPAYLTLPEEIVSASEQDRDAFLLPFLATAATRRDWR